jgi:hypothetical protein
MEKAMKSLPISKCVGWTKIDAKPLKKSLEILVSKWSYMYIKYLQDKVVNEMDDLYSFMGTANKVLDLKVGDETTADGEGEEDKETVVKPEDVDPVEVRKEKEQEVCLSSAVVACRGCKVPKVCNCTTTLGAD